MNALLLIVLGEAFANNIFLESALGTAPLLGISRKSGKVLAMGLAVTLCMLLSTLLAYPIHALVLLPLGAEYLRTLVFVLLVAGVVYAMDACSRHAFKAPLKLYAPMIALNSAVLGIALMTSSTASWGEALLMSVGSGLGLLLALLVVSGIMSRIDEESVPKAFRGLPLMLIVVAIASMALFAFK